MLTQFRVSVSLSSSTSPEELEFHLHVPLAPATGSGNLYQLPVGISLGLTQEAAGNHTCDWVCIEEGLPNMFGALSWDGWDARDTWSLSLYLSFYPRLLHGMTVLGLQEDGSFQTSCGQAGKFCIISVVFCSLKQSQGWPWLMEGGNGPHCSVRGAANNLWPDLTYHLPNSIFFSWKWWAYLLSVLNCCVTPNPLGLCFYMFLWFSVLRLTSNNNSLNLQVL